MSHKDALEHYGTDRPDLRFKMPLKRLDSLAKRSSFTVFTEGLEKGGVVKGICVKGGADISRKMIEGYTEFVKKFDIPGLAWMKKEAEGFTSNIVKFFTPELLQELEELFQAEPSDLLFMAVGDEEKVNQGLDHLRRKLAKDRNLIDPNALAFLWVVDFPLMKWDETTKRIESEHHPFTSPHFEDIALLDKDPLKVRAMAYDIVLNGYEIGGGSQRIHSGELQQKIFEILKLTPEEIEKKFGFFVDALKYGTPPHLGLALGLDRIVMIMTKTDNIRDVIAFPKTQRASDLMMQCPSPVSSQQLKELQITAETKEISWI
jgi:aspartyl-tRNA synthetase